MKKLLNFLFSMQMMGVLIILFAFSIGTATFIENDFGTSAAKALVYNARWFEVLLLLLAINLVVNIFRYELFKRKKWSIFLFHVAFIVIFIGSGATRYVGHEGNMHIREGKSTNQITTTDPYIDVLIKKKGQQIRESEKMKFSTKKPTSYREDFEIKEGNKITLTLKTFIPNAEPVLVQDINGAPALEMVMAGKSRAMGMQNFSLEYNTQKHIGNYLLAFGDRLIPDAIVLNYTDSLRLKSPVPVSESNMMGGKAIFMEAGQWHVIQPKKLYNFGDTKLVVKNFYPAAKYQYVQGQDQNAPSILVFDVSSGNEKKELIVKGQSDIVGNPSSVNINGIDVSVAYGPKIIDLPFSLQLNDFQLERYPGSNSPSSFASEVTLFDDKSGVEKDYRIYMNNILKHEGYRFYQSSYDKDEKGTILSVNHDQWGMMITYFGYFILILGMAWSLVNPYSRFRKLGQQSKKAKAVVVLACIMGGSLLSAPAQNQGLNVVSLEQSKNFGEILVQDNGGRFEPINTLASEVVRKVTKKSKFQGYPAEQVFLSMIVNPQYWQTVPMIKVGNSELARELGISGKHGSFTDFVTGHGQYKLGKKVQDAYAKKPAHRSKYDKEIISVDERVNIAYMVFTGEFLKIFPDPSDPMHTWYYPSSLVEFSGDDSLFVKKTIPLLAQALTHSNLEEADSYIEGIKKYQQKYGNEVIPSQTKQRVEIMYNNINIFKRLFPFYLLVGFILVIFLVVKVLRPAFSVKWAVRTAIVILGIGFALHTAGLAARWYISGHAPWSNGFESMTYVAWACLLAGFMFVKKSYFALASTAILGGLSLFVAHLSWMSPEVTNLVPVLKSYWLTIHVAIITASYGFLALSAILGLINLMLMNFRNNSNQERIANNILDLSRVSEMSMTIGLYFLAIGSFLGAIWANESWGRYWGWDPKETWALVSILVYSFVLHMRLIPGLKSVYAFNLASVWAYGSILMTYFGVNYYLAGLHSYAQGDPVPVPTWVYCTVAVILALSFVAYYNYRKHNTMLEEIEA